MGEYQNTPKRPSTMGIIFGVIMIIVYLGMGILLLTPVFASLIQIEWMRIVMGVMLCIYGVWRCIRQIKGMN